MKQDNTTARSPWSFRAARTGLAVTMSVVVATAIVCVAGASASAVTLTEKGSVRMVATPAVPAPAVTLTQLVRSDGSVDVSAHLSGFVPNSTVRSTLYFKTSLEPDPRLIGSKSMVLDGSGGSVRAFAWTRIHPEMSQYFRIVVEPGTPREVASEWLSVGRG